MVMSMCPSFQCSKSTRRASVTVAPHCKPPQMSWESKAHHKTPSSLENSSCAWLQNHRDGTFLPKGSARLLGPQTYEQVLKENNFFLTQVATIPVNLEYNAWFAIIDPNATSDMDLVSLNDHLLCKPWFLQIESVSPDKCLLITTRPNLPEACMWVDENLELLIWKSILMGIDPPSSLLLRHLDKPVYTTTSKSYTEVLKKQFSLASTPTMTSKDNN